jgi:uncharacterized protein (DUF58 family)
LIFDESTLHKLNALSLVAHQVRAGMIKGERRSTKRGSSIEFADYRDYVPGDDLRRLDWKVYARLDQPYIKLLEEEEDLAVHILIDASRSMDWGEDEYNKFQYVRKLAAGLGVTALSSGDRMTLQMFQGQLQPGKYGPARGQHHIPRLLKFLEVQKTVGTTDLDLSIRQYAQASTRAGLAILLSDLFSPDGYQDGLTRLQNKGFEVIVIHILSPDEVDPPQAGDLRLIDSETNGTQEVSLDGGMRRLYRERVSAWQEEIRAYCSKRGIRYFPISTALPWDKFIFNELRKARVVK